jgi:hypothetical protein
VSPAGRARAPRCARCGGADLFGPAPLRTSAHPNSSPILVETPGAHFHDHPVQATVCLACGAVDLSLSGPTLEAFRSEVRPRKRRGGR